jgi:hypothetical protein
MRGGVGRPSRLGPSASLPPATRALRAVVRRQCAPAHLPVLPNALQQNSYKSNILFVPPGSRYPSPIEESGSLLFAAQGRLEAPDQREEIEPLERGAARTRAVLRHRAVAARGQARDRKENRPEPEVRRRGERPYFLVRHALFMNFCIRLHNSVYLKSGADHFFCSL